MLYEILAGRKSMERDRPKTEQKLLDWVKHYPADSKKFGMIMDPRLENQYSLSAARRIAKLADSCLLKSAKDRPKMSEVVEALNQIIQISGVESPLTAKCASNDDEENDAVEENLGMQEGVSDSTKRRMEHLAKISENLGGVDRRKFMIMHRAKVM